jgi:hypothetical protein
VDRRAFLTSLGAGLLGPLAAEAQPAGKVPRIGILCAVFCRAFSVGLARNQFSRSSRWLRSMRATFFMGSIWDRRVCVHQRSRNRPAQVGDT